MLVGLYPVGAGGAVVWPIVDFRHGVWNEMMGSSTVHGVALDGRDLYQQMESELKYWLIILLSNHDGM